MKNISTQYQELKEGKMTQHQFLRNARMMFPSFISNLNSFDDSVKILKTRGLLNEGEAVKGTPDKTPQYDSPTPDAENKYKKVEQSPEVAEQDGVYPATSLTDIPKVKKNKKVVNKSDGLEPIKDKDDKNGMKKVPTSKTLKENLDSKEVSSLHPEGKFWVVTFKSKDGKKEKSFDSEGEARKFWNSLNEESENLDEERFKKGTDIGKKGPGFKKVAKAAEKEYGSKEAGKRVAGAILKKVLNKESSGSLKERLRPLVKKLINEVLDELGKESNE